MGNFSFTRAERIRSKSEFQELKKQGAVFRTKQLLFNFAPRPDLTRFGFVVTKKVGGSVYRNKVKRWLREAFRHNKQGFTVPLGLVVVPRVSELSYGDIVRDIKYFQKWYDEKNARRAH